MAFATEAPQPILPETSEVIWGNVAVMAVLVAAVALAAWFLVRFLRSRRRP